MTIDMPDRRSAGRCLLVGFDGVELDAVVREALLALDPAGIILFRRNLDSPERLLAMMAELQSLLPGHRLLALDQEGGRVSRLHPWVGPTPTAARLALAGEDSARSFARATARALRALGFNFDLAPVVDLSDDRPDDAIGDRSFGTDPIRTAALAGAFLDGLADEGIAGCLKHFPGLGRTTVDSHADRPTIGRSAQELEEGDLLPYSILGPRAPAVLVGHGAYPALDPIGDRPASLSPAIVEGYLRGKLGYDGVVATDDLEMGALRALEAGAAVAAVEAGCDLLLYCRDLDRARHAKEALVSRAEEDPAFAERLTAAAARVERLAARWPASLGDLVAWSRAREDLSGFCAVG